MIADQQGQVKKTINKLHGLNDNAVLHLYKDQEGGLWASLNKGISRINYPSPVTYLNESSGLDGLVLDILKKGNKLYAGTSSGLYVIDDEATVPEFKKVPQLQNEVWKVHDVGKEILIVSSPGIYVMKGNVLKQVSPPTENTIYKTIHRSHTNPDKFYIGSSKGLFIITHRRGRWKWEGKIKGVNHDVIWLAEDKKEVLWASCDDNVSAIDDSEEYGLTPPVRNLRPSDDLVKKLRRFQVHNVDGKIYFGTSKGIYSFQKNGKRLQLKPNATFGAAFADGSREAINLTEDKYGHIWLTSEFKTGQLRKLQNKPYVWDTIPLSLMPRVDVWTIHTDPKGVVWLGTTEGIYRYNPDIPKNYKAQPQTVLRKVTLAEDSTVFFGTFFKNGAVSIEQPPGYNVTLPHSIR